MKTLILCVDRDDDFGVKANITSPIIGRKDNLRAAISLGLKDPEDSDTNSLFAAIQLYDQYRDDGQECEIATLCGNKSVGTKSDRIIGIQLETVLDLTDPNHVLVVSDGAEDEFILPIISSRVKIDSVKRVIIRQQKNIEGTVYFIAKALQDEKIRKNVVIPISLIFLIWGISLFFENAFNYALGATLFTMGCYLLIRAFNLEEPAILIGKDMKDALQSGKYILAATTLIAIMVLSIGIFQAYMIIFVENSPSLQSFLEFLETSFIYFISTALIYVLGKTLDTYVRTGIFMRSSVFIIPAVAAAWFIFLAVIPLFQHFLQMTGVFDFSWFLLYVGLGFIFGYFSISVYYYMKQHFPENHPGVN